MHTTRELKLSELRAKWAIRQQQANRLQAAINVLADPKMKPDAALRTADIICNANIGP